MWSARTDAHIVYRRTCGQLRQMSRSFKTREVVHNVCYQAYGPFRQMCKLPIFKPMLSSGRCPVCLSLNLWCSGRCQDRLLPSLWSPQTVAHIANRKAYGQFRQMFRLSIFKPVCRCSDCLSSNLYFTQVYVQIVYRQILHRRQIEFCFSPDVIRYGWSGLKYQLTN